MMMARNTDRPSVLDIRLGQTRVGTITHLPHDRNLFLFADAYVQHESRPVLSLNFYDAEGRLRTEPQQSQTKVPPFFSNLLPEGHLREYLAEKGEINPDREFFLLWLLGEDMAGAITVQDSEGRSLPPSQTAPGNKTSNRGDLLRFSLAGVQLKFSAVGDGRNLTLPAEGRGGGWIVKLPSPQYPSVPENEYSMMTLARNVGLDVADVGLQKTAEIAGLPQEIVKKFANQNSLVVRRFDRNSDGGRIHIEDFNQVYGQYPGEKYRNYGYTTMASDIWKLIGEHALVEFVQRLVFNALIGNADMHLKNWSLIYRDGRTPALAPAYDLVSTVRYLPDEKMALPFAGKKQFAALDEYRLARLADKAAIPRQIVIDAGTEAARTTIQCWREAKGSLPIDAETTARIEEQIASVPLAKRFLGA